MKILADIGGTYARFALAESAGFSELKKYRVADFSSCVEALDAYCREMDIKKKSTLAIATAAHEEGDVWRFVDPNAWRIEPAALEKAGWKIECILNDFAASTWGLVNLEEKDFQLLKKGEKKNVPRCLMGPGTGLGLGFLIPLQRGFHVQRTHGAHMQGIAITEEQQALVKTVGQLKKDGTIVSFENLVSGPGLQNIHDALCHMNGVKNTFTRAEDILSNSTDKQVKTALRLFHEFMGLFAQMAVITVHAYGGLYLTGGMTDRLAEKSMFDFASFEKYFSLNFVDFVAHDIKSMQVARITHPALAMRGLLEVGKQ